MNKNIPSNLTVYLTSSCNLHCNYCYESKDFSGSTMTLDNFKKLLETYSDTSIKRLHLFGGEPLLNKEVISYLISMKNLPNNIQALSINTNGTLLTNDIIKYLEGINSFTCISLDGIKNSHDFNRTFKNKAGSFDTIFTNIQHIRNFSKFGISYIVSKDTIPFLLDSVFFLKEMGFRNIWINFLYEDSWNAQDFRNLLVCLLKIKKISLLNYENFYNELNYQGGISCKEHMFESLSIGPNLEIIPCGYRRSKSLKNLGIHLSDMGFLRKDFNLKEELNKKVFSDKQINKIMKYGRICEIGKGNKYMENKKKIHFILKGVFQ